MALAILVIIANRLIKSSSRPFASSLHIPTIPATAMSCSLVGPDFTDKYMIELEPEKPDDASDVSSVVSTTASSEPSKASTDADSIHDGGYIYLDMDASHLTAVSIAFPPKRQR